MVSISNGSRRKNVRKSNSCFGRRRVIINFSIVFVLGALWVWQWAAIDVEYSDGDLLSYLPDAAADNLRNVASIDYYNSINNFLGSQQSSLEAFGLSVNNLQRIEKAEGALKNEQIGGVPEDFLPVVTLDSPIALRFRLRGVAGNPVSGMKDITAYQVQIRLAHDSNSRRSLWDSGKVSVHKAPREIVLPDLNVVKALAPGMVVSWRVAVWDANGNGPATSDWTKFAVGPNQWTGQWIVHPQDPENFKQSTNMIYSGSVSTEQCNDWNNRRPLPIARSIFQLSGAEQSKEVVSALLVGTGLGSFSASMNGMPLSSSSPLDPSMMDYTRRISYRGFDVTSHFQGVEGKSRQHVVGITLGSGWWDGRPLNHRIIKSSLLPRGPLTAVAELHLIFSDGSSAVKIPSGTSWQVAKGFLRDSDLFTGDTTDLEALTRMKGWNQNAAQSDSDAKIEWKPAALYPKDVSYADWRRALFSIVRKNNTSVIPVTIAPLGKLIPSEAPPVLPVERIHPESRVSLGQGRWLYDFGKGFSGVVRFDNGLAVPMVPKDGYPRGHSVKAKDNESFISVVYGDSLTMETKDINLIISAGMGYNGDTTEKIREEGGPCFPEDHGTSLLQRDVFIAGKGNRKAFAEARQALFTTHSFRFAEVCCTQEPPADVVALVYRTAVEEWGKFDSSNVLLNGAYELTKNAFVSNIVGTQSDCPHREKLPYGGDLVADSPSALHFFDVSAFYAKIIHDWADTQWDNGAYTETSVWQDLNENTAIGWDEQSGTSLGAGETGWASAPPILTVRHAQHYGDMNLLKSTFDHHTKWLSFLQTHFDNGIEKHFGRFGKKLETYYGNDGGLGDWLSIFSRDTWLTHHAFAMASARAVAFLANRLDGKKDIGAEAFKTAESIQNTITSLYMKPNGFGVRSDMTPGPDLALHARVVPGDKRCVALLKWVAMQGNKDKMVWPGDEEQRFYQHLNKADLNQLVKDGFILVEEGSDAQKQKKYMSLWSNRHGMGMGIFALRYTMTTLSDLGFHDIALSKAAAVEIPSFDYMLSHNATTLWETWWRSEDVYSRNHPMLGAIGEWLVTAAAGVGLAPTTFGGEDILFWPRIPKSSRVLSHASATQGTRRGSASIAWKFVGLSPKPSKSQSIKVVIRISAPPGTTSILRLPGEVEGRSTIRSLAVIPDLMKANEKAREECSSRRSKGLGYPYNWEYVNDTWVKFKRGKAIGTPCESFLFDSDIDSSTWGDVVPVASILEKAGQYGIELKLEPGIHEVEIQGWELSSDEEAIKPNDKARPCADPRTFSWDLNDAVHII